LAEAVKLLALQLAISTGMFNAGPVANEQTHHVRMGAMGRDVYIGIAIDAGPFTAKLMHVPTHLVVWPCEQQPCESISRFHHRAPQESHAEQFALSIAAVGVKYRVLNAGLTANVIHGARPHFWGATPMLTVGVWGELKPCYRAACIEMGASVIPRQGARWVVLEEHAGSKTNGQPLRHKQRTIVALYAGFTVRTR
jgi:hypothetical protein